MDAVYVEYYGQISKKIKVWCMHHVIKLLGFEILQDIMEGIFPRWSTFFVLF
jgi:hypothetical protein